MCDSVIMHVNFIFLFERKSENEKKKCSSINQYEIWKQIHEDEFHIENV